MKKLLLILLCAPLIGLGQETGCISGDCENGWGTYIWNEGDKYVGEFKDSYINGQGTYTMVDGTVYKGLWERDNFLGE